MKYYPVFMDINNKSCLVVGGGSVGVRKAVTLEKCGAKVTVISDKLATEYDSLKKTTSIVFIKKEFEKNDVKNMFFVFAATDNSDLNLKIQSHAAKSGILCNIADSPEKSDFILPSIVERGDLTIAISTSGKSPAMAKKIRQELERKFGNEYGLFLTLMGSIRKKLLSSGHAPDDHKLIFQTLIKKGVLNLIKTKSENKINLILNEALGQNYLYQDLMSPDLILNKEDK